MKERASRARFFPRRFLAAPTPASLREPRSTTLPRPFRRSASGSREGACAVRRSSPQSFNAGKGLCTLVRLQGGRPPSGWFRASNRGTLEIGAFLPHRRSSRAANQSAQPDGSPCYQAGWPAGVSRPCPLIERLEMTAAGPLETSRVSLPFPAKGCG